MSSQNLINNFSHKLFGKLSSGKNENFFISPYSISTCLSMCHTGAKNDTAAQLKDLLSFGKLNDNEVVELNNKYISNINNLGSEIVLNTANKIYPQAGAQIKADFADSLKKNFSSEVEQVNFGEPEKAAETINGWVASKTNNKIKDLIPASSLNDLTRLVLVNAIYFKGSWAQKFEKEQTTKMDFFTDDAQSKQIDMMQLNGHKFNFQFHPNDLFANACELPYIGNKVSMTILLPEMGTKLADIESKLTPEIVHNIITGQVIENKKVNVVLPKFKLEYKNELTAHFKELGASLPFDQARADFSGINDDGLHISKVFHQAVVEVGEEGTEAAAATGAVMMMRMAPLDTPADFVCNHPFLFFIHEKVHNTILFIGKYSKPE